MTKQVTLSIDGKSVTVPAGTVIVDAAKKVGIDIPIFCYHPKMEPVGMCRMCLVAIGRPMFDRSTREPILNEDGSQKIQFGPKLETACTVPVSEGMVVIGLSDEVKAAREDILELLLTSHPLDCPICDKGGECPLQNLTMAYGSSESHFVYTDKQKADKHYPLGDLIFLDRERCIQCARCIRFQKEIAGDAVLEFFQRGRRTDIVTFSEPGFDSYWSGNTTDICPVGALTTADFRFGARAWELQQAASICSHCPVGCNLTINVRREVKSGGGIAIKRIMPRQNEWVNEIWICDKGRFVHHFTDSKDRLTHPLDCRDGKFVETSWEDSINFLTHRLENIQDKLLTIVSGRLSNEDLFNLKELTLGLGGSIGLYTQMAGGDLTSRYGLSGDSNLTNLGEGDVVVVVASDLEEEAPVWYLRVKAAAERGAKLIVANARPTKLDHYASETIRYHFGKEVDAVRGIDLAGGENVVIFFGSEGMDLVGSAALADACADLFKNAGNVGKVNNGLVGVWPRVNDQGAWDIGLRPLGDLKAAIEAATVVYIVGADPAGDDENIKLLLSECKKRPEKLTVVQDLFLTETAELADIILPALAPTEREGTFTSGERRVQRFYQAATPKGDAKADLSITGILGSKLGLEMESRIPSLVFSRLSGQVPGYSGLNYQKLAQVQEQWPIFKRSDLYYGGTGYENNAGLGVQLPLLPISSPSEEWVWKDQISTSQESLLSGDGLIAVPVTKLYDMGVMMVPTEILRNRVAEPIVTMNPADAQAQKTADGMTVNVSVNGASAPAVVKLDDSVPVGIVLVPRNCGIPVTKPEKILIRIAEASLT